MTDKQTKTKGKPDPVDIYVGKRLRVRRSLLGWSQEKLADAIGLTFQQVQKYERGVNRISAGRLYQFSEILNVPVTYFYDMVQNDSNKAAIGMSDTDQEAFDRGDILQDKNVIALIKAYSEIKDADMRQEVLRIVKSMSALSNKM